ncbi:Gfo/Idh/MocA family protein [Litorihabitans aurantiacus]|uniref:Dehydrogenase n=1 Tax=Litorihabitans aurantiacus TaxID=1930061 RepID=A0AA37XH09_9MICO|nr:Gfo/Idh/MocA family oxidoreductase [Litorihabitans aurantiacus]GMA32555.1 dehydrogenase [Litorihabitans aurantiacus]
MTGSVRAAVVGCGDVSIVHLRAIAEREGSELVGVADVDTGRREAASRTWSVPGFAGVEELVAAVRPDVVHVCTPHHQHAPVAVAALQADVSVLIEKPLADSLEAAHRIAAAERRSRGKLAVCFQNRYNRPVRALAERLRSGDLGPVLGASAQVLWRRTGEYYRARPWRGTWAGGGGGLLMNQAIHTLDLLQWLLPPVEARSGSAATRSLSQHIEVEDTAELSLTHRGGARSTLFATLGHARNAPVRLEVVTRDAVAVLQEDLRIEHADGTAEVVLDDAPRHAGRSYWGASHALLIDDFHAGLDAAAPFWIGLDAGIDTLATIAAVYAASFPERGGTLRKDIS